MTVATFGEKQEGVQYVNRYGVYAVIPDEKQEKIILVQAPNGAWFLPGGEYEQSQAPLEDFNQLAWFPIEEAISKLKRGSHKWGIEMWKKNHKV